MIWYKNYYDKGVASIVVVVFVQQWKPFVSNGDDDFKINKPAMIFLLKII